MNDPELIPDDQWDDYSFLPNPTWYEKQKEQQDLQVSHKHEKD